MEKFPIVRNEALLRSFLNSHPDYVRASVCSCGKILSMTSAPGHIGGSNKKWTISKAKWQPKHKVIGYTIMVRNPTIVERIGPGSLLERIEALEARK